MNYTITGTSQLADVLRGLRKARDLTQRELAQRAGLLPKTVSSLETKPKAVQLENLFKYLSALRVEVTLRELPGQQTSSPPVTLSTESW